MPRKPRHFRAGAVYHLISRFIDHEWFLTHDRERAWYLELLGRSLARTDWRCISYAVMSSHIHLGTIAGHEPFDVWIRRVHGPFADTINKELGRIGSLFVRGPRDIRTPPDRVGRLLAYIHNNPVRAGVVQSASESDWTSHRAYLGLEPRPRWLHVDEGLARGGFSTPAELDAFTRLAPQDPTRDDRGRALRDDGEEISEQDARVSPTADANAVVEAVAIVTKTPVACLTSHRRNRACTVARRAAVHCADALGIRGATIARALGISQQRVSAILVRGAAAGELRTVVERAMERVAKK